MSHRCIQCITFPTPSRSSCRNIHSSNITAADPTKLVESGRELNFCPAFRSHHGRAKLSQRRADTGQGGILCSSFEITAQIAWYRGLNASVCGLAGRLSTHHVHTGSQKRGHSADYSPGLALPRQPSDAKARELQLRAETGVGHARALRNIRTVAQTAQIFSTLMCSMFLLCT